MGGELLEVGALVRVARERAGLSMNELAAIAGTSVSTISRVESGSFDPRWSTVEAVMTALGTTVDRERDLARNARTARYRERLGNIFSAAQLVAPSYTPVELWTLLEGTTTGGKPLIEELAARGVARAYDQTLADARQQRFGSEWDAVRAGEDAVAAGASLGEGVARMAALLALWAGRRLFIPADMKTAVASIRDAARFAVAA